MSELLTIYHKESGHICSNLSGDYLNNCPDIENPNVDFLLGHYSFRSEYVDTSSGLIRERKTIELAVNKQLVFTGSEVTITKPNDCWLMVDGRYTLDSNFIIGSRDFRATCVGKYIGEVYLPVKSIDSVKTELLNKALLDWFKTTIQAEPIVNATVSELEAIYLATICISK